MNMAQRGVFQRPANSGIWWTNYYIDGVQHREKVGRKSDALALYRKRKESAAAGRKLERPLRQREKTFKECADLALKYSAVHKSNVSDDSQKIAILVEEFGSRIASSIKQQEIASFLDSRNRSNGTFNRYRAAISMIYREAIREGWLDVNPARLVKAKKEASGRIRYLSEAEESRLRSVIAQEYSSFLVEFDLALHTGMRLSEQFGLKWEEVDLDGNRIDLARTKNGVGRSIPLNSVARSVLESQKRITGRSSHVFLNSSNEPFRKSPIRRWFEGATTKARVKDFTWHGLRHTYASRLIMAGVDLRTVQELMGHKTIQMTVRYSHLSKPHLLEAIERLVSKTGTPQAPAKSSQPTGTSTGTELKSRKYR
jgi:site-specific recombinase XerD